MTASTSSTAERHLANAGSTIDVPTAARILGISRWLAYQLIARGEFPVPTLRLGSRHRIPTQPLRRLLENGPLA